jgi:hypothetical protein
MSKKNPPAVAAPTVETAVTRKIDLEPEDWFRAPWRKRKPLPRPELTPHWTRDDALEELRLKSGEPLSAAEAKRRLLGKSVLVDGVHFEVLFPCLSADEFLDVLGDDKVMTNSWDTATYVLRWFHRGAVSYVPSSSWEKLRPQLREELKTPTSGRR